MHEVLDAKRNERLSPGSILCFTGPPGTGKTSIGRSVAEALELRRGFAELRIEHVPRKQNAIADALDNCTLIPNADQRDTNDDGYGNLCDADLNDDGIVNAVDLGLLQRDSALGLAQRALRFRALVGHFVYREGEGVGCRAQPDTLRIVALGNRAADQVVNDHEDQDDDGAEAVAVAIEGGLFTPVLKDAEMKSLSALSTERA